MSNVISLTRDRQELHRSALVPRVPACDMLQLLDRRCKDCVTSSPTPCTMCGANSAAVKELLIPARRASAVVSGEMFVGTIEKVWRKDQVNNLPQMFAVQFSPEISHGQGLPSGLQSVPMRAVLKELDASDVPEGEHLFVYNVSEGQGGLASVALVATKAFMREVLVLDEPSAPDATGTTRHTDLQWWVDLGTVCNDGARIKSVDAEGESLQPASASNKCVPIAVAGALLAVVDGTPLDELIPAEHAAAVAAGARQNAALMALCEDARRYASNPECTLRMSEFVCDLGLREHGVAKDSVMARLVLELSQLEIGGAPTVEAATVMLVANGMLEHGNATDDLLIDVALGAAEVWTDEKLAKLYGKFPDIARAMQKAGTLTVDMAMQFARISYAHRILQLQAGSDSDHFVVSKLHCMLSREGIGNLVTICEVGRSLRFRVEHEIGLRSELPFLAMVHTPRHYELLFATRPATVDGMLLPQDLMIVHVDQLATNGNTSERSAVWQQVVAQAASTKTNPTAKGKSAHAAEAAHTAAIKAMELRVKDAEAGTSARRREGDVVPLARRA